MDKLIEEKLKNAANVRDMLQELIAYYRLEDCDPGVMTRAMLIAGLKDAIKKIQPVKR